MRPVGEIVVVVGMEVVKVSSALMYWRDAMVIMTQGRRVESCIFRLCSCWYKTGLQLPRSIVMLEGCLNLIDHN